MPRGLYFSKALFEGIVFGGAYEGAYLRREICISKSIGLALYLEVNLPFFLCIWGQFSEYKLLRGLYLEGRFNGAGADPGFFFRRGCTRLLLYFNTNKPHSFFFLQNTSCIRKQQVISGGGEGVCTPCTLPLDPPLRRVFCITSLGGLSLEGLIFGILRYLKKKITKQCLK